MYKKVYYLLMTAGSFAIVIMLGIIVMLLASCSLYSPQMLPDKGIDLTIPPKITEDILCCIPDEDYPLSCGSWKVCEFNSQGELI